MESVGGQRRLGPVVGVGGWTRVSVQPTVGERGCVCRRRSRWVDVGVSMKGVGKRWCVGAVVGVGCVGPVGIGGWVQSWCCWRCKWSLMVQPEAELHGTTVVL